jgi:hypothetical protein
VDAADRPLLEVDAAASSYQPSGQVTEVGLVTDEGNTDSGGVVLKSRQHGGSATAGREGV